MCPLLASSTCTPGVPTTSTSLIRGSGVFVHQPRAAAVCALRTARVRDILLVLPKIGSVRAARILAHCGIAHSRTLAGLSERQRGELITFFRA